MSILKAFLLTLLLIILYSVFQIGLIYGTYLFEIDGEYFVIWNATANIISFFFAYYLIFKFFWTEKINFNEVLNFRRINDNILFYIVLMVIGLHLFNKPFWNIENIWQYFKYSELDPVIREPDELNLYFLIRSLSILIIAPVFEEIFFRKFLISKLTEKHSLVTSIIVSSILFSLIHIETPKNIFPTFICGIISGLLFIKTGRIAYPILFHFLYNLIIQLLRVSYFPLDTFLDSLEFNLVYWSIALLGAILTSGGIYRIFKIKD